MTTAAEYVSRMAESYRMYIYKSEDTDYELRPSEEGSQADLIQLVWFLQNYGFTLQFLSDNSIHVHAPHRKEHEWSNRGWDCQMGLTVDGCIEYAKYAKQREVESYESD